MPKGEKAEILTVEGKEVRVSNPDKPYFSREAKLSKLDVVRYYLAVAPGALTGVRDRPIVLKRFVDGAEGEPFYQKRAPENRPDWLRTATLSFPGGRTAQWWISFGDAPSQAVELFGSRGRLRIDRAWNNEDQPTRVDLIDAAGESRHIGFEPTFQFAAQLEHLCDCLRTGRPHRIPPADSLGQMRALDALYASLRSGRPEPVAQPAPTAR